MLSFLDLFDPGLELLVIPDGDSLFKFLVGIDLIQAVLFSKNPDSARPDQGFYDNFLVGRGCTH